MYDAYLFVAGNRLPIVMAIAMREQVSPHGVVAGQQDAILVKDSGWIQLYAESCQEILDSILMAYRLAEDPDILLPVNVCYEGFYLSYQSQRVEIHNQTDVDSFLSSVSPKKIEPKMCLEKPMTFSSYTFPGELYSEYRFKHCAAMQRTLEKCEHIDREFESIFGYGYGGQIEEYKTHDAEMIVVTMGSATGTAKGMIDRMQKKGVKVGLIKIRLFRPFPRQRLLEALQGKKALAVIDRNVFYSGFCGHVYSELKPLLYELSSPPSIFLNFIAGLGGADITPQQIERVIHMTSDALNGKPIPNVNWLSLDNEELVS
jgi:pyruvate/2-oxoacid:ferredoxin oxidoreductase alpha subunit